MGKAAQSKIGAVDSHDHGCVAVYRLFKIPDEGLVGGANLPHDRAGLSHDLGHPETAADLHQLTAGDDDFPPFSQRGQHQKHRGGVVVDHQGAFSPGNDLEQFFHL